MNCKQARKLFGAYWDDELTQAEREWLETHFGSCTACRTAYEELGRSLELVGSLPRVEVAPDFAERTLARARRATTEPDRLTGGSPRWIPITAAAALVAVIGATVIQWVGPNLVPTRPGATLTLPSIPQPELVASNVDAERSVDATVAPSITRGVTEVPDSLFDHAEDVEFILDPVTLKKGRALTVVRSPQEPPQAQQAVITF